MPIAPPDLSSRPIQLTLERTMTASPPVLFRAWIEQFDRWFAAPGTVLMRPKVDAPLLLRNALCARAPSTLRKISQARA